MEHAACKRHRGSRYINGLSPRKGNWHETIKKWQVVSHRFQFVVCLFGRSTTWTLSLYLDDPPTTKGKGARAFSVLSRIVSRRRVLVSVNVQLKYNKIVTCKLPHRAAQRRQPNPNFPFNRCSFSPPSAPTTFSSFQLINSYIHIRSPSLSPMI